jgi:prepilin-type N-terminal cleavage/methylation domain-containing protein
VDRGFSLIEVLVASSLMTLATIGLAHLSINSIRVNRVARSTTFAIVLASQKMAQLQALTWAADSAGAPVSDTSTDTTVAPEASAGGTGLAASPSDALVANTLGYCDFLDAYGQPLGGGTTPPRTTAYVRRWAIEALSTADTVMIQVWVTPVGIRPSAAVVGRNGGRHPEEARLVVLKTRKSG